MKLETENINNKSSESVDFSALVLDRIEKEHVAPSPRWQFLLVEYGVWFLWGLSVIVGALAFSVMIFFATHAGFAFYEATHDTVFDFLFEIVPFAWVSVFVLMAILAHYNLRHTKKGYRYTVFQVLVSSILFSFAGGILFHFVGMGFMVDDFVGRQIPQFPTLERIETRMWQNPGGGRMVATYIGEGALENIALVSDPHGVQWQVTIDELNPHDLENLYSGERVYIMGVPSSTADKIFYGCGVFPETLRKNVTFNDIKKDREVFVSRMKDFQKDMLQELIATDTEPEIMQRSVCVNHDAVIRVKREFAR